MGWSVQASKSLTSKDKEGASLEQEARARNSSADNKGRHSHCTPMVLVVPPGEWTFPSQAESREAAAQGTAQYHLPPRPRHRLVVEKQAKISEGPPFLLNEKYKPLDPCSRQTHSQSQAARSRAEVAAPNLLRCPWTCSFSLKQRGCPCRPQPRQCYSCKQGWGVRERPLSRVAHTRIRRQR